MRSINHCITTSKSGKSAHFRIIVDDRFGKQAVTISSVTGWRAKLATKYLLFDTAEWNDSTVRQFVGIHVVKAARDKFEARQYIEHIKSLGSMEVHFWANKFLINENAPKAWRAFYS